MALTREQFAELRAKGLSPQQIADFEAGKTPSSTKGVPANAKLIKAEDESPEGNQVERIGGQLYSIPPEMRESSPLRDTFTGLAKSVGRTALGIGTLGRGIQRGISSVTGFDMGGESVFDINSSKRAQANEFLRPKSQAEKTAGFVGDVATAMIPSSAALKGTKGLGFAMKMLGQGSVGAITGTLQGGGDIDRDTLIGAGTEVMFPVAGKALGYGGNVLKGLAGMVSGKGGDVIEQVVKTPRAALEGGELVGAAGLKESAQNIRTGVKTLKQKAGAEFEALTAPYTTPLPKNKLTSVVNNYLVDEVDATISKGAINLDDTPFLDADAQKIQRIYNIVNKWEDTSPKGINSLASKISKFYKGSDSSQDVDRVVAGLNRRIRDFIGEQVPDIAEANAKYADKMDLIDQMDAIFRTKGAVESRLGLQKTAEAVGRLFNANKDIAREGVEEIERELGINILGKEAGRQLVDGVSRSQSAIGDAMTGVARALIPPKLILQIAARTGMAQQAIESRLNVLEPSARAVVIEVLTDLFGEGEIPDQPQTGVQTTSI